MSVGNFLTFIAWIGGGRSILTAGQQPLPSNQSSVTSGKTNSDATIIAGGADAIRIGNYASEHLLIAVRQPRGPRITTDESGLGPVDLADQQRNTAGRNRPKYEWSPVAALEDTVSRMQRDLEELQTENRFLRTPRAPVPVPLVRQSALTTTKVPWFNGSTSWEQYQQVFDAIVLSNGWGDATAALQLLSHLQTLLVGRKTKTDSKEGVRLSDQ